jgi:hypothetical protein
MYFFWLAEVHPLEKTFDPKKNGAKLNKRKKL